MELMHPRGPLSASYSAQKTGHQEVEKVGLHRINSTFQKKKNNSVALTVFSHSKDLGTQSDRDSLQVALVELVELVRLEEPGEGGTASN